jgi:hypothetical protein
MSLLVCSLLAAWSRWCAGRRETYEPEKMASEPGVHGSSKEVETTE